MLLLTVLAFIVGPVDTWSTNVISAIFLQELTLACIKTVAAFFYGNGVPFFMTHQFLCNYHVFEWTTLAM